MGRNGASYATVCKLDICLTELDRSMRPLWVKQHLKGLITVTALQR